MNSKATGFRLGFVGGLDGVSLMCWEAFLQTLVVLWALLGYTMDMVVHMEFLEWVWRSLWDYAASSHGSAAGFFAWGVALWA